MNISLILLIFGFIIIDVVSSRDYIIYGTPGGRRGSAGLYGGYYEFGKKLDMELTHINRASYKHTSMHGISIASMSYDPVSGNVLLLGSNNFSPFLAKADPCKNDIIEEKDIYVRPYYKLIAGPFALYDSDVYYVSREHRLVNRTSVRMSLTIRKVTGCRNDGQGFVGRKGYPRPECSVEVGKILDTELARAGRFSDYKARDIAEHIKPVGSTLLAIKRDGKMYFFVQIANPLYFTGEFTTFYI